MITAICVYPRSGGTVFSSAIAASRDVVLLSEVNPSHNAAGNIAQQMWRWHKVKLAEGTFEEMALAAHQFCDAQNKRLVVRDFSFINFTPHAQNQFQPKNVFETLVALQKCNRVKPIALVRNAFDVWISRGCPPKFSTYYLDYVKALLAAEMPIFYYEEFCKNPEETLKKVCQYIEIAYSENMLNSAINLMKVTGDVDLATPSRGRKKGKIAVLKRQKLPRFLRHKAEADNALKEANRLLGYSDQFEAAAQENWPPQFWVEIKWHFKKWLKKYPQDLY